MDIQIELVENEISVANALTYTPRLKLLRRRYQKESSTADTEKESSTAADGQEAEGGARF
jgi:hypothetical protein